MKATDTLLSTIIIGVTLIIMTVCSQSEDLIDAGAQALNAATNNDKELVLTASEQTALSVKQKGSYNISEKEAKKNQRVVEIKEIRLSLNIDTHDFETKRNHAIRFLNDGNKVKVSIRFRGREMGHPELGADIMKRFAESLADTANVDKPAKLEGRNMLMFLAPKPVK